MAKLGDICLLITDGSHFSPADNENGYPMLSVKDMGENDFSFDDCKHISEEDYEILVKQGCKPEVNDVLLAKDGSYFRYAFVVKESREIAVLSSIAIIRPNQSMVNSDYLRFFLLHEKTYQTVSLNYITGTALKRVILKGIKKIDVPLPDLSTQRQIAANLDKVTHTIDLCNAILEKLDLLVKSRFVEMFGDIVHDDNIPKVLLSELADIGSSKRIYANEYVDDGIPFYRSKEIRELGSGLKPTTELFITNERYKEIKKKYGVPKTGDILIAAIGATIGYSWIVDTEKPFYYKDGNLIILSVKDNVNSVFLNHTMGIIIEDFKNKGVSGSEPLQ